MHTFQQYELSQIDFNPYTLIGHDWMLISAGTEEKANSMTASWGGLGVIWGVNAATIYVRESRFTKEFIDREKYFSLSFLSEDFRSTLSYMGKASGRDEDKMEKAGLHYNYKHGIPFVDEASQIMICKKLAAVPITEEHFTNPAIKTKWYADNDMHTMYIGEIVAAFAR
jgi:flavin reductase (DIM6/NTAB) family NADH-FMN oxidoreductase RutF